MPKKATNKSRLVRLADRVSVMLVYLWAKHGTISPFDDDDFWTSDDCNEIRAMPEYQQAMEVVREML